MKAYVGIVRITCDAATHAGEAAENAGPGCLHCPGALVEVLDLERIVIAEITISQPPETTGAELGG